MAVAKVHPLNTPDVCKSIREILSRKETLHKRLGSCWHSALVAKIKLASCLFFASFHWLNFTGLFSKDLTFFSNSWCWFLNAAVKKKVRGVPQAFLNFTLNPYWPLNRQASMTIKPSPAANSLALSGMLAASLTINASAFVRSWVFVMLNCCSATSNLSS